MEKIRNIGFDMTKAFAIYLVLVGHCIQYLSSSDYRDDNLWIFIYSFHMPLFMLVAGYFSASSYKLDFKSLIVKKTKQLIIPMLFWSILIFLAIQFFRQLTHKPILPFVELFVTFATCFWFLKSLFICYVMLFLILKLKYKKTLFLWGGVMMLIFSQFVSIWNVNTMFPCFLAGYIIRTKDNWLQYIKNNWFICFLFFVVLELFYSRYIYISTSRNCEHSYLC